VENKEEGEKCRITLRMGFSEDPMIRRENKFPRKGAGLMNGLLWATVMKKQKTAWPRNGDGIQNAAPSRVGRDIGVVKYWSR